MDNATFIKLTNADLDKASFELNAAGEVSRRSTAKISGDVNVDSSSVDTSGYVGKASGTNADFTTVYTSATTLTFSGLPSDVSTFTAEDIVSITQIATDGSVTNTITRDDNAMTMSGHVLTVVGAAFVSQTNGQHIQFSAPHYYALLYTKKQARLKE